MTQVEFEEFLRHYYREPHPERAPEALECFIDSQFLRTPGTRELMLYLFARIALMHPEAAEGYRSTKDRASPTGQAFVTQFYRFSPRSLPNSSKRV